MNSIKTHIDSKQFTDLFNQRYVKSLNEIRKSNPFSKMIINISNIKDLLDNNEDGYVNDCYQIDNNFLIWKPFPPGPIDSYDPYYLNKYLLFTERFIARVMMDGKESIVVDVSGNKIHPADADIEKIKDIVFEFINSKELTTGYIQFELVMDRNQTSFTILGME